MPLARKGRGGYAVEIEVYNKEGLLLYSFDNLEMTANFFNVDKHIIRYRLNSGKTLKLPLLGSAKREEVYFKRAIELNSFLIIKYFCIRLNLKQV